MQAIVRLLVILATFIPFGPLGEELGWRGYALPRLETHVSPLVSSLALGIIWAVWHVPMFWFAPIGLPQRSLIAVAAWAANVLSFSILLSYVARRTSYSVPIAILLHATLNAGPAMGLAALVAPPSDLQAVAASAHLLRWIAVFAAAVGLLRDARPLGRRS
jgi:membrane protease YdiL (CAAX protease family)